MKRTILNTLALWMASVPAALAASGAREDNSGIFVWVFLGFCALIIIAQMMPAIMILLGFAKGVKKEKESSPEKAGH